MIVASPPSVASTQHPRLRSTVRKLELVTGVARRRARRRTRGVDDAVFVWIPKTAGTSLWAVLRARGGGLYRHPTTVRWEFPGRGLASFGHLRYADLVRTGLVSRDFDRSAHKFCIVRDPFDRTTSLYEYLLVHGRLRPDLRFEEFTALLRDRCYEPIGLYNSRGLSQCNPQVTWIVDDEGNRIVDEIGRFEDLGVIAGSLHRRLGTSPTIPHENRSDHTSRRDRYYASPQARRDVEAAYREDFEAFGY